ncbi:hypothetical protein Nepgr_004272 [Nepenthes gracilis]|uniref:F-box protein n=1 Tax=Nepenthes gracilis TaxID=150966 RepID=A0AAD3S156_NEPGR|nr:hypothetical protein Nepgr_004272 [Nepenthes gracilis]
MTSGGEERQSSARLSERMAERAAAAERQLTRAGRAVAAGLSRRANCEEKEKEKHFTAISYSNNHDNNNGNAMNNTHYRYTVLLVHRNCFNRALMEPISDMVIYKFCSELCQWNKLIVNLYSYRFDWFFPTTYVVAHESKLHMINPGVNKFTAFGVSHGHLRVTYSSHDDPYMDVWELDQDENGIGRWCLAYNIYVAEIVVTVGKLRNLSRIIAFHPYKDVVYIKFDNHIIVYNLRTTLKEAIYPLYPSDLKSVLADPRYGWPKAFPLLHNKVPTPVPSLTQNDVYHKLLSKLY